ncbi:MAG: hypothetical protein HC902_10220 [Calothrix sp. SM1_5_4]|nr:hypothetical protein [Calothrix sp. SM1_5_4]
MLLLHAGAGAADGVSGSAADQIESTRAGISETERRQREELSSLFVINKRIKEISKKAPKLNERLMSQEAKVRLAAQDVHALEERADRHQDMLNRRLRQLYQERGQGAVQWIFSPGTPVEMDRHRRFLKLMVDSDHRQLKRYVGSLRELRGKRQELKGWWLN